MMNVHAALSQNNPNITFTQSAMKVKTAKLRKTFWNIQMLCKNSDFVLNNENQIPTASNQVWGKLNTVITFLLNSFASLQ